ncbi:MAG TPA: nuclear transport factor 2 family protein [Solirubrobacterales bacterium]
MSEENVEVVKSVVEAWNRGDYSAALEPVAPEIKVESNLGGDIDGTYEGIAGLQKWLAGFWGSFVDFHTEIEDCISQGDEVVFSAHHYGRGKGSGVGVEMHNWQVCTVRDGKIVRYRLFRTKPEALEAAGLRE